MRCHGSKAIQQFSVLEFTVQCFHIYLWDKGEAPKTRHVMPIEVRRPSCELEPRRHLFRARYSTQYIRALVLRLFEHSKVLQRSRSKSIRA
jgi:hypothetical protein